VEKFLEAIDEEDPQALDESADDIFKQALAGFVPLPTAVVPMLENLGNMDSVTGRPIIPRGLEDIDETFQRNRGTSAVSIAIAEFVNGDEVSQEGKVSPLMIDNMVNGWAGGLGMTLYRDGGNILSRAMRSMRGPDDAHGPAPARDALQVIPGLRGMISTFPFGSRSVEEAYDLAERARVASRTESSLYNSLAVEDYVEWIERHAELGAIEPVTRGIIEDLSKFRDDKRLLMNADMDPEEKRKQLYILDRGMLETSRELVRVMKNMGIRPQGRPTLIGKAVSRFINPGG